MRRKKLSRAARKELLTAVNGTQIQVTWGNFSVYAGLDVPFGLIGFSGQIESPSWRPEIDDEEIADTNDDVKSH